jgi:hypothetical protein
MTPAALSGIDAAMALLERLIRKPTLADWNA